MGEQVNGMLDAPVWHQLGLSLLPQLGIWALTVGSGPPPFHPAAGRRPIHTCLLQPRPGRGRPLKEGVGPWLSQALV